MQGKYMQYIVFYKHKNNYSFLVDEGRVSIYGFVTVKMK